jgi:hypothetical protein
MIFCLIVRGSLFRLGVLPVLPIRPPGYSGLNALAPMTGDTLDV